MVDEYDISEAASSPNWCTTNRKVCDERQREYAWLTGDVRPEDQALQYGHRAAIVLFTGSAQTGKTFLARRVEALLVADSPACLFIGR